MSLVITGFALDRQENSLSWQSKDKLEKKASLLSRALASQQSVRIEPFSYDQFTPTTEEGTDDEYDEDCDSESHSSLHSPSVPIPRARSRVAKLFQYARFQLHVQQAQLQELQNQQKQTVLMQQDKVYGQMGLQGRS